MKIKNQTIRPVLGEIGRLSSGNMCTDEKGEIFLIPKNTSHPEKNRVEIMNLTKCEMQVVDLKLMVMKLPQGSTVELEQE